MEQVSYTEILDYADHQRQAGNQVNLVNRMLLAVRYYFTYLQKEDKITHNPAAGISLKGAIRTVPKDLLEKAELEALYESYVVKDERSQRNKVMLSLLIYQGVSNAELHKQEILNPKNYYSFVHFNDLEQYFLLYCTDSRELYYIRRKEF